MIIAVDFDGTIVRHRYPKIGEEIPFATQTLAMLIRDGHRLDGEWHRLGLYEEEEEEKRGFFSRLFSRD